MLCFGICEISDVAVIDVIVDAAATVAIASLFTVHQHNFLHLTHHTPYTIHHPQAPIGTSRSKSYKC
jgi:hypothetical protein